jgi:ubiquitin-protein ligase
MGSVRLPVFLKRINKEIENFNDKKYISLVSEPIENIFSQITLEVINENESYFLKIYKNNKFFLELSISSCYPFKPYEIANIINNIYYNKININNNLNRISYSKHLNNIYEQVKLLDKKILLFFFENQYLIESKFLNLDHKSCYCCNSITCPSQWSPSCRIDHLLVEYLEFKFIKKYTSRLQYKYLKNIYNNLLQQLPDEIIISIINNY